MPKRQKPPCMPDPHQITRERKKPGDRKIKHEDNGQSEEKKKEKTTARQSPTSQQDQVIARRNARLAVRLLRLPPPAAHVAHLEDVVLREADLVGVVRVRLVAVDGLGAVRVLDLAGLRARLLRGLLLGVGRAEAGDGAAATGVASRTAGVARDGRRGLEAVELGGGVELGLGCEGRRRVRGLRGHLARGAGGGVVLVEGVRVNEGAVGSLRLGAVIEDPDDLSCQQLLDVHGCVEGKGLPRSCSAG